MAEKARDGVSKKKLAGLLKKLKTGDSFDREKATESLCAMNDPEVVAQVSPLLKDDETAVRMSVLEILKRTGSTNLNAITALLDDENEDVRTYGCEILTELKDPSTISHLIRILHEDEENVRNAACMALGQFHRDEAVEALLGALSDTAWVKFSAIYGLGNIGSEKAISSLLRMFREEEEEIALACCEVLTSFHDDRILGEVFEVLKGFPKDRRDVFLKIILEKEDEYLTDALMEKVGPELFDHLLQCIRFDKKKSLYMLRQLTRFNSVESCNVILEVFKEMEADSEEYEELLRLFGSLRPVWELEAARYIRADESLSVPFIRACGREGVVLGEDLFLEVFRSAPTSVRREIIANLPSIIRGNGYSIIKEAIVDMDGHVKGGAVVAAGLKAIGELREDVKLLAQTGFFDVRIKAMKALIRIDLQAALALIVRFMDAGSVEDKKVYLAVADTLSSEENFLFIRDLLSDKDEGVRRASAGVMGNFLSDERYADLFESLLMKRDIPHEVLKVIKEQRLVRFRGRLVEIFADETQGLWTRYYALAALASFEDHELFETFVRGLDDENSLIKIGSLKALSDLDDMKAIEYVRPFVMSPDDDVRATAEFVMEKLECY